ncbi:MAG: hypothetical protein KDA81_21345 [Planctomycetaceae bacterium]|nr:hypothetical protein [Planctomycetaceae bacterium]
MGRFVQLCGRTMALTAAVLLIIPSSVLAEEIQQTAGQRARRVLRTCPPPSQPFCPPQIVPLDVPPAENHVPIIPVPVPEETLPSAPSSDDGASKPETPPSTTPTPQPDNSQTQLPPMDLQNQFNDQPNFIQPQMNNALANVGDTGFSGSRAPNMIGDFFGTSYVPFSPSINGPSSFPSVLEHSIYGNLAAAPGANVGRLKMAENASPIPTDRFFVNYSYFNDVNILKGLSINRVTVGFESTIFNENMSVEVRTPFAQTAASTTYFNDTETFYRTDASQTGNMSIWFKALLAQSCTMSVAAGIGATLPTADSYFVIDERTDTLALMVKNKTVHFLPYVATVYTPTDRSFFQMMTQFDIDSQGNPIYFDDGGGLGQIGRFNDNNFVFFDAQVGYWVYKNNCCNAAITGIAPIVEFHHNRTLNTGDAIPALGLNAPGKSNVSNLIVGLTARLGGNSSMTMGYATPVGGDRQFDGEFRLTFNWVPGYTSSATR